MLKGDISKVKVQDDVGKNKLEKANFLFWMEYSVEASGPEVKN